MSKLTMTGMGMSSNICLINNNNAPAGNIIMAGQVNNANGGPANINAHFAEIEITNTHHLNIDSCNYIFNNIDVNTGGVLDFNNTCQMGDAVTNINVGQNSTMVLIGEEMNLGTVSLDSHCIFNFVHNPMNFNIKMPVLTNPTIINDMHKLAELCVFLSNQDFGNKNFHLPLNHSHALKLYEQNKEIMDIILKTNFSVIKHGNVVNANDTIVCIEKYINTHFFELAGIKKFVDSPKEVFNGELHAGLVLEIGSYIDLDDVNY